MRLKHGGVVHPCHLFPFAVDQCPVPVVPVQAGASLAGNDSSDASSTGSAAVFRCEKRLEHAAAGISDLALAVAISPVSISCLKRRSACSTYAPGRCPARDTTIAPNLPAGGMYCSAM